MSELLVITCAACKTEKRFILPLGEETDRRWVCACESAGQVSARFQGLGTDVAVPDKFLPLDTLLRQVLVGMGLEGEQDQQWA